MPKFINVEIKGLEDKKVWRYMDISKFLSMIINSSVTFTRLDCFEDLYEGMAMDSWETYEMYRKLFKVIGKKEFNENEKGIKELANNTQKYFKFVKDRIEKTFINCWHMNEYESVAMWDLYVPNKTGIAIQTTVGKLSKQLRGKNKNYAIFDDTGEQVYELPDCLQNGFFMRKVEYGFSSSEIFSNKGCKFSEIFVKRPCFSYENEYRIAILNLDINSKVVFVKVDLKDLIDKIYISPRIQKWEREVIINLIKLYNSKYNFLRGEKCLIKSSLFDRSS